ncbi:MAG: ATP-binding protein [Thiovulaceae bacterium]|nr:ATP-binding protein [Sulfurimonadaceae bacterium]
MKENLMIDMLKSIDFKKNTLLLLFVIITASFMAIFYIFHIFEHEMLDDTKTQHYEKIKSSFQKNVDLHLKEHYISIANTFLNEDVLKAVAQRDRKQLKALTQDKFNQLKKEDKYFKIMDFYQYDDTPLLSLNDPTYFGSNVPKKNAILSFAHRQGTPIPSFDYDSGGFCYHIIIPLFYQGNYVGAFEIGVNPEKVLDLVTHFNNIQGILKFSDNNRTTQYKRINSDEVLRLIPQNMDIPSYKEIYQNGKYYAIYSFDISPYNHMTKGKAIFFDDLTKAHLALTHASQKIFFIFVLLLTILYFILNYVLNRYSNALTATNKQAKSILDTQSNIVLVTDGNKITEANKAFLNFLKVKDLKLFLEQYNCICEYFEHEDGYLQPKMNGVTWTQHILANPNLTHLAKIKQDEKIYLFKVFANILNDNDIVVTMQDITQELERENRLKESELRLKKSQAIAHLGNWELDIVNNKLSWSDEIFTIFEIDKNKFGASYEAFVNSIYPQDREQVHNTYMNSLQTKQKYEIIHRLQMADKRIKYVHEQCDTTFDHNGNPILSFGTVQDITKSVLAEQELQQKSLLLEHQSRLAALGEMIGNIAHQWRQPLSVISVISGTIIFENEMEMEIDSDALMLRMNNINEQVEYLSTTINDFKNFLNEEDHHKTFFKISDAIKDSIKITNAIYENNLITINQDIDEDISHFGLKSILSQVILNLLANAKDALIQNNIKNKQVNILLQKSNNLIIIKVQDNGGGIDDEIKSKIFDPYFSTKHQSQGTGLGLYMSSQIIQKYFNGHISVSNIEDQNGVGACFMIEFPDIMS